MGSKIRGQEVKKDMTGKRIKSKRGKTVVGGSGD